MRVACCARGAGPFLPTVVAGSTCLDTKVCIDMVNTTEGVQRCVQSYVQAVVSRKVLSDDHEVFRNSACKSRAP